MVPNRSRPRFMGRLPLRVEPASLSVKEVTTCLFLAVGLLGCSDSNAGRFAEYSTCESCRIDVKPLLTFENASEFPIDVPIVLTAGHGGYYIVTASAPDVVARYDAEGKFLRQSLGRGQGPGELKAVRLVEPTSQGLVVMDGMNRRRLLMTPDLQSLDDTPLPFTPRPDGYVRLPQGTEVVIAHQVDDRRDPGSIHVLDSASTISSSFEWPFYYSGRFLDVEMTLASDSSFWVYNRRTAHAIEMGVDGSLIRSLDPPPWFVPGDYDNLGPEEGMAPIHDTLLSVLIGPEGLWMLYMVPDPNWTGSGRRSAESIAEMSDTVLQLVDPDTGAILASTVLEQFGDHLLPDNRLVVVRAEPSGLPVVEIYSFQRGSAL